MLLLFKQFFTNYIVMSALVGWFTAQALKIVTGYFKNKKFSIVDAMFGSGGMPSSHSAAVMATAVATCIVFTPASFEFAVAGVPLPYRLRYSAREGVLTAMHSLQWQSLQDSRFLTEKGYIGHREKWVKWNFRGDGFRLFAPKGPDLGCAEIRVDGYLLATVDLHAQEPETSQAVYEVRGLPGESRHAVVLRGYEGQAFAVDVLEALGAPDKEILPYGQVT